MDEVIDEAAADMRLRACHASCLPGSRLAAGAARCRPAFWQHDPASEHSVAAWVDSTLRFFEMTGTRLVKLTGPGHYQVAARGVEGYWRGAPLGERTIVRRAVHGVEDWARIPLGGLTAPEQDAVAAAAAVRRRLPPDVPLLATVFAPATQAMMLAEPEVFRAHLRREPRLMADALAAIAEQTCRLVAHFRAAGVNGIFLASKHHASSALCPAAYAGPVAESDRRVIDGCAVFSANILHLHGDDIHFAGLPEHGRWFVHYEARRPGLAAFRAASALPAAICPDYAEWEGEGALASALARGLIDLEQSHALLCSPCAVPLRMPRERIAEWVRRAEGLA